MEALSLPEARRCPGPAVAGRPLRRRRRAAVALRSSDDDYLTGLAAAGEEAAFEVLYERYSAAILRYLRRRMRSAEEAEDVHQQVFLSAFSALRTGVEPLHFKAWLYRIAHNVCVSELRVQRPPTGPIDDERSLACMRADAAPRGREDLRELLDDLALLPRAQSSALLLREVHDLSYAEIAETLHLPVGAVRSNIFRARASLQGLAAARDVDCAEIRVELKRLAGRRGRRSARIANHLRVCRSCEDFRRGLRRRPAALSLLPLLPVTWPRPLRALMGSPASEATAGELAAVGVSAGGVAAGAKLAAVVSVVAISVTGTASQVSQEPDPRTGGPAVAAPAFAGPAATAIGPMESTPGRAVPTPQQVPASGLAPGAAPAPGPGIVVPVPPAQQPVTPGEVEKKESVEVVAPPTPTPDPPGAAKPAPLAAMDGPAPGPAPAPAPAPTGSGAPGEGTSGPSEPSSPPAVEPAPPAESDDGGRQRRRRNRGDSSGSGSAEEQRRLEQEAAAPPPPSEEPADAPAAEAPAAEEPAAQEQPAEEPAPEPAPADAPDQP